MRGSRRPLKVLIVEDNPGDAALLQTFFRHQGRKCTFSVVGDGESALDFVWRRGAHADAARPDLIIVDINIPKVDGKEVLREIKLDPKLKVIPTIVLTSSENDEDVRRCYENGANCVLIKGADIDEASRVFELLESFWVNTVRLPFPAPVLTPVEEAESSESHG